MLEEFLDPLVVGVQLYRLLQTPPAVGQSNLIVHGVVGVVVLYYQAAQFQNGLVVPGSWSETLSRLRLIFGHSSGLSE